MEKPEIVYLNEDVVSHPRVKALMDKLSGVKFQCVTQVPQLKKGDWYITKNLGSFIKPCPGQKGYVCCNLWVAEWALGCPLQCEYCILQIYTPPKSLTLYANLEVMEKELEEKAKRIKGLMRLTTGEYTDSLAIEPFWHTAGVFLKVAEKVGNLRVEFKTKSTFVEPLRELRQWAGYGTVGFSLNPQSFIQKFEKGTASLAERLEAAEKALAWSYGLSFHFDPILPFDGWEEAYDQAIFALKGFPEEKIRWISLGVFRFPLSLKEKVKENYPDSPLFHGEYYPSKDGKMRLLRPLRQKIYQAIYHKLRQTLPKTAVYFCMESPWLWDQVGKESMDTQGLTGYLDHAIP